MVGDDFTQLGSHQLGITGLATKAGQDVSRAVELPTLNKVSWAFREDEQANSKDQRPQHLDRNGDAIRPSISSILGAIINTRCQKQSECDAELISRH